MASYRCDEEWIPACIRQMAYPLLLNTSGGMSMNYSLPGQLPLNVNSSIEYLCGVIRRWTIGCTRISWCETELYFVTPIRIDCFSPCFVGILYSKSWLSVVMMFGSCPLSSFLSSSFRYFCDELKSLRCGTRGVRVVCGAKCHLWQILHRYGTRSVPFCSFSRVASSWASRGESYSVSGSQFELSKHDKLFRIMLNPPKLPKGEWCECATCLLPQITRGMSNADYSPPASCSTPALSLASPHQSCK